MTRQTQQLSDALDDYDRFRKSTDIKPATIKGQRSTLSKFLAVNGNVWVHQIDTTHVMRFFEEASKTRQRQTLRNDHTYLLGFFKWCRETGRMARDVDPMFGRRRPARADRERDRVHVSGFSALLDAAESRCPRDRAVTALLLYTLGRDAEISSLRIGDVDLDAGFIKMVIHKTNEEDRMPICKELDSELRRWLTYYTEEVGFLERSYFLVPNRRTRGVRGPSGVYESAEQIELLPTKRLGPLGNVVTPVLAAYGFPVKDENGKGLGEGAHTIRRSGARALFDQLTSMGYDKALRVVQSMLHHKSGAQTEAYLGIKADRRSRDEFIRGQWLYALPENVVEMRRSDNDGNEAEHGQDLRQVP